MNSLVRFLEESLTWQFAFEINWPLEHFFHIRSEQFSKQNTLSSFCFIALFSELFTMGWPFLLIIDQGCQDIQTRRDVYLGIKKQIVKPRILPKKEWMNSFLLACDLFLFVFLEESMARKKCFEVIWPLVINKICCKFKIEEVLKQNSFSNLLIEMYRSNTLDSYLEQTIRM